MSDSSPASQAPTAPLGAAALLDEVDLTTREQEILLVCAQLLTEIGYERLTIDAVAARARASKATIYRRWPGKAALVFETVRRLTDSAHIAPEYTGDLRADLRQLLTNARDRFVDKVTLIAGMIHAMQTDRDLAVLLRSDIARCQLNVAALLARYTLDGVVTAANAEVLAQVAGATLIHRLLITGESVDEDYLDLLVDQVLLPLLGAPRTS